MWTLTVPLFGQGDFRPVVRNADSLKVEYFIGHVQLISTLLDLVEVELVRVDSEMQTGVLFGV